MQSEVNPADTHYDDEISLSELIAKLWAKRGLIVFLPLVLAGLTVVGLLTQKVVRGDSLSYFVELTAVEKGSYPNGTQFSPQDLLNPEVVAQLAKDFNLEAPEKLPEHIRISMGTPASIGLLAEYKAALAANSKARPEEVEAVTEKYRSRIRDAASRGVSIEVDYVALGLSKEDGARLALAIPAAWNNLYINRFSVLTDTRIANIAVIDQPSDITTAVGAMEANLHLRAINKGLGIIAADSRFRTIKTADGTGPADLMQRIADFQSIFFEPIYVASFGDNQSLSKVYQRDHQLRLNELEEELTELDNRITTIKNMQSLSNGGEGNGGLSQGAGSQLQLESDALGQLVSLSRQASLSEYLQESFEARIKLVRERAELRTELKKMQIDTPSTESGSLLGTDFVAVAEERYGRIRDQYRDLLNVAKTMMEASTPLMYQQITGLSSTQKLLEKRDLLFIALALALGGMLAVIAALLWPNRTER